MVHFCFMTTGRDISSSISQEMTDVPTSGLQRRSNALCDARASFPLRETLTPAYHTAIEIAKWVGTAGHVHALDINSSFVSLARKNADAAGVGDRVTLHQCDGSILPLPDGSRIG